MQSEHLPFLSEIAAHPDDDAPRLIFADFLEERGDPRGEFIRVQCRLAALPLDAPERPALEAREEQLLYRAFDLWMRDIPTLVGLRWGRKTAWDFATHWLKDIREPFVRGLPQAVRLTEAIGGQRRADLHTKGLDALVRELGVRDVQLPSGQMARLPDCLQGLPAFVVPRAQMLDEFSEFFRAVRRLRLFNVDYPGTPAGAASLINASELEILAVDGQLDDEAAGAWLRETPFPRLKSLLIDTDLSLGEQTCRFLSQLSSLEQLALGERRGVHLTAEHLTHVLASPLGRRLKSLQLTCANDAMAQSLRAAPWVKNLVTLSLPTLPGRAVYFSRAGTEALADSPHLASLRRLIVAGQQLGDEDLAPLCATPHLANLTHLCLADNRLLTDATCAAILKSPYLTQLRVLQLRGAYITRAMRDRLGTRFEQVDSSREFLD